MVKVMIGKLRRSKFGGVSIGAQSLGGRGLPRFGEFRCCVVWLGAERFGGLHAIKILQSRR